MGMPVIIGAGVGALSSAAMGKSPLTGALLGGVTGGAFGGAEGFGSGFTQGGLLSSAAPAATTSATSGAGVQLGSVAANTADDLALNAVDDAAFNQAVNTSLPTNVAGGGGAGINIKPYMNVADDGLGFAASNAPSTGIPLSFNQGIDSLKLDPRRLVVDTPLTFGERLSDIGSSAFSYGKDNPMTLLGGANALSGINAQTNQAQQQRLNTAVATGAKGITKPNFDPSSAIAAAPSYGLSRDEVSKGKMAQIASQARLNDEDERRIGQFYQSLIG
jgi:hypothetical protein